MWYVVRWRSRISGCCPKMTSRKGFNTTQEAPSPGPNPPETRVTFIERVTFPSGKKPEATFLSTVPYYKNQKIRGEIASIYPRGNEGELSTHVKWQQAAHVRLTITARYNSETIV